MNPSIRRQVLREWRGLPDAMERPERAKSVAEVLPVAFKKMGLGEKLNETEVMQAWKEIVGEFIAAHSFPQRFARGVLYVQVVQPTLHYELDREWKPEILKKLKARFGARKIREVRFRV